MEDQQEIPEDASDDEVFLAKFGSLIDSLLETDVSTKESFDFNNMAEDCQVFSPMDIERITSDLFAVRIRYSISLVVLNVISSLSRPRASWRASLGGIKRARAKMDVLINLMESINDCDKGNG